MPRRPVFAVLYGGSCYGYSRSPVLAADALARGHKRGASSAAVRELTSPPRGMKADAWLTPFDDHKPGFR